MTPYLTAVRICASVELTRFAPSSPERRRQQSAWSAGIRAEDVPDYQAKLLSTIACQIDAAKKWLRLAREAGNSFEATAARVQAYVCIKNATQSRSALVSLSVEAWEDVA